MTTTLRSRGRVLLCTGLLALAALAMGGEAVSADGNTIGVLSAGSTSSNPILVQTNNTGGAIGAVALVPYPPGNLIAVNSVGVTRDITSTAGGTEVVGRINVDGRTLSGGNVTP